MASNREREELHKAIWSIADDLRGSVDGWDFKQYVLGLLFYRFISENPISQGITVLCLPCLILSFSRPHFAGTASAPD